MLPVFLLLPSVELLSPQFLCAILLLLSVSWVPLLGFPFRSFLSCAWFTCLFLLVGVFLFLVISSCAFFLASQWLFLYGGLASSLPVCLVLGIPLGSLGALLPRSTLVLSATGSSLWVESVAYWILCAPL